MARCSRCSREMRPHGTRKEDAPGTVVAMARGLCAGCYKPSAHAAPASVDDNAPCVLVRTTLRPSTWRVLARFAKENDCEVGAVLSILADRAVLPRERLRAEPKPVGAVRQPTDDIDRRIAELNAAQMNDEDIAAVVGLHQTSVSRRRRLLGLRSPGRRTKRAA